MVKSERWARGCLITVGIVGVLIGLVAIFDPPRRDLDAHQRLPAHVRERQEAEAWAKITVLLKFRSHAWSPRFPDYPMSRALDRINPSRRRDGTYATRWTWDVRQLRDGWWRIRVDLAVSPRPYRCTFTYHPDRDQLRPANAGARRLLLRRRPP